MFSLYSTDFIQHVRFGIKSDRLKCDLLESKVVQLQSLPFFLCGQSMGGGIATFLSVKLQEDKNYRGMILLAPALAGNVPNPTIVSILEYTVGTCSPSAEMPSWLNNAGDNSLTFMHRSTLDYVELDKWGNPGGLGWGRNMRWATGLMFIRMFEAFTLEAANIRSPFLVLHDPDDKVDTCALHTNINIIYFMYRLSNIIMTAFCYFQL